MDLFNTHKKYVQLILLCALIIRLGIRNITRVVYNYYKYKLFYPTL